MSDLDHAEWLNGPEQAECRHCGPACDCPRDEDAPPLCDHGKPWGESCPACGAAVAAESADALLRALRRIERQKQDAVGYKERLWSQR